MKDRIVQYPNRYKLTQVSGNIYDLTPEPGIVTEPGTPLNKALFDKMLAAIGQTSGSASALTLTAPDFSLLDGVVVRFKTHVAVPKGATLNVNGTGAKPIIGISGKGVAIAAGSYCTVVYNATSGNFILQGEGGGQGRFGNDPGQISTYQFVEMGYKSVLGGF